MFGVKLLLIMGVQFGGAHVLYNGNYSAIVPRLTTSVERMVKELERFVEPSIDPCDDFARYSCRQYGHLADEPFTVGCNEGSGPEDNGDIWIIIEELNSFKSTTTSRKKRTAEVYLKKVRKNLEEILKQASESSDNDHTFEPWFRKFAFLYFIIDDPLLHTTHEDGSLSPQQVVKYLALQGAVLHSTDFLENKKFVLQLMPLAKTTMLNMLAAITNNELTDDDRRKINQLFDNDHHHIIGAVPKLNDLMNELTQYLEVSPRSSNKDNIFNLLNWHDSLSDIGARVLQSKAFFKTTVFWNAQYIPKTNEIVFGGSFLNKPAFAENTSYAYFFGSSLVPYFHELGHAFETIVVDNGHGRGDKLDSFGREFQSCVVNKLESTKIIPDCDSTLSSRQYNEAAADDVGVAIAWNIYDKFYKHMDPETYTLRDGTKLTREQVFFIGFGSAYCTEDNHSLDDIYIQQNRDIHPFGKNRANMAAWSSKIFPGAFYCPAKHQCLKSLYL